MSAPEPFPAAADADSAEPISEPEAVPAANAAAVPDARPALAAPAPQPSSMALGAAPGAAQSGKAENTAKEMVVSDARARADAVPEGKLQTDVVQNAYRHIRALLKAGKRKQARAALHELTLAQPSVVLPADLKALAKEH
jgi:hypothetical protein